MSLRYNWLRWRGYEPYKYVTVVHSWNGEDPPAFGTYSQLKMRKGMSIKAITFKNVATGEALRELIQADMARRHDMTALAAEITAERAGRKAADLDPLKGRPDGEQG